MSTGVIVGLSSVAGIICLIGVFAAAMLVYKRQQLATVKHKLRQRVSSEGSMHSRQSRMSSIYRKQGSGAARVGPEGRDSVKAKNELKKKNSQDLVLQGASRALVKRSSPPPRHQSGKSGKSSASETLENEKYSLEQENIHNNARKPSGTLCGGSPNQSVTELESTVENFPRTGSSLSSSLFLTDEINSMLDEQYKIMPSSAARNSSQFPSYGATSNYCPTLPASTTIARYKDEKEAIDTEYINESPQIDSNKCENLLQVAEWVQLPEALTAAVSGTDDSSSSLSYLSEISSANGQH